MCDIFQIADVWGGEHATAAGPEHTVNLSSEVHWIDDVLDDLVGDHDIRRSIFQRKCPIQVRFMEFPTIGLSAAHLLQSSPRNVQPNSLLEIVRQIVKTLPGAATEIHHTLAGANYRT